MSVRRTTALNRFVLGPDENQRATPASIRDNFVAALGVGKTAVEASGYLTSSLGLTSLVVLFGFLIGLTGVYPKVFGTVTALSVASAIVLVVVSG